MTSSSSPATPLVGRDREVEQLSELLRVGPAVLITGAFGVGKSTLVDAVVNRDAGEGRLPRPAWTSLAGARDARTLLQCCASALGILCPPVAEADSASEALVELLRGQPHTLVWDDAHEAALEPLLAALDAVLACAPVAAASRLAVIARGEGGRSLRQALEDRGVPTLEVAALDPVASVQLLQALELARGRTIYEALATHAGGNPLGLQLGLAAVGFGELDPAQRARQILDTLPAASRSLLALLVAAEVPVPLSVLEAHAGVEAREELPTLVRRGLVQLEQARVLLAAGTAQAFRPLLGEPDAATNAALVELADRLLAAAPDDPELLRLACGARSRAFRRGAGGAIQLLRRHAVARGRLAPAALRALCREIAAADPRTSQECQLLLAEEELRTGDFAAAERTLAALPARGLPQELAARTSLLRARALARSGNPAASAEALGRARRLARFELAGDAELSAASLLLLRGDVDEARRLLRRAGRAARTRPRGQRSLLLGISYMLEGRLGRGLACARRARREFRRRGEPGDALITVVEVLALLSLDQLERAGGLADREAAEAARRADASATTPLLQAMVLDRAGALAEARRLAERARRILERRADRLLAVLAAHQLFRCALAMGTYDRAEELTRELAAAGDDPELAALRPIADFQAALLHAARGERAQGAERAQRALAGGFRTARVRVEAWALSAEPGPCPPTGARAGDAYGALRAAERGLDEGRLDEAEALAASAARWYGEAGARLDLARAQVARAEALARLGRSAEARGAVDEALALAHRAGVGPLIVAAELVRAHLAEREGDRAGAAHAVSAALEAAGAGLVDRALLDAAARASVAPPSAAPARGQPWRARIERLGLARPVAARFHLAGRTWLLAEGETWPAHPQLVVRYALGDVWSPSLNAARPLSGPALKLLTAVARAGPVGVTLEDLHTLRGGRSYHPLRHRNAIYVALTRLRESVEDLMSGGELVEVVEGRCRVPASLQVAVLEPAGAEDAGAG